MSKFKLSLFALVAMAAVACVADPAMEGEGAKADLIPATKSINHSESASQGSLLLFVDEATAEAWTVDATRSGNAQLDAIASEIQLFSVEPLFNMNIDGDAKRQFDMHRWFVVKFSDELNLEAVAKQFAESSSIERVQYNTMLKRPQVQVIPASDEELMTRAENDEPFNDPQLPLQWHYNNKGLQSIFAGSKEGEDIGAYGAWKYTTGNRDVIVAVVDEGVKYNHEDLKDNMWVNTAELNGTPGVDDDGNGYKDDIYGLNAVDLNGDISWDVPYYNSKGEYVGDSGHGTHVAGTIAAVNNNGIGVGGVAGGDGSGNGVRIMSIQIFDGGGSSGVDKCAKGVEYAADMGASILQNSWGYTDSGKQYTDETYMKACAAEYQAMKYFASKSNCAAMTGNVIIFAAGNNALDAADYPGAYNEFIAVTATGPDGYPTTYTNYKSGCNVAAPGGETIKAGANWSYKGNVYSTLPSETVGTDGKDYGYMAGTSMACPHVSGVAALVLSYALDNGIKLTNTELYDILASSVRNIDDSLTGSVTRHNYYGSEYQFNLQPYKGNMGTGKLDATLAIMNLRGATCVPVTVGQEFAFRVGDFMGTNDLNVTMVKDFVIPEDVKERLGVTADFFNNTIYLECAKAGIGVITVKYIAGGKNVGGGANTGGKLMEKEVVIISRENNDNGAWL